MLIYRIIMLLSGVIQSYGSITITLLYVNKHNSYSSLHQHKVTLLGGSIIITLILCYYVKAYNPYHFRYTNTV